MRPLIVVAALLAGACQREGHEEQLARAVIATHCSACHTVPGVANAVGRVGPALDRIGNQQLIAGRLPNSRANLAWWIGHAQEVAPGVAMPDLALSERQAGAVADYLLRMDPKR
jgi:mono/diheme cytochrome c family protein